MCTVVWHVLYWARAFMIYCIGFWWIDLCILQVDLKAHVPQRLANYVCRRQTLAISALSKYLLSSSSS